MARFTIFACVFVCVCTYFAFCNADCGQIIENKLDDSDKKIIVDFHNNLRSLVSDGKVPRQPKPRKRLVNLTWDSSLAAAAQKIANTCNYGHVKVQDSRWSHVGQNIGWQGATFKKKGSAWKYIIQLWFDEYKNFTYPNTSNGVTGHYTQVIWADTKYIGCGYKMYRSSQYYEKLYVCNYGPGGNYIGQPPYET